jgi:O-antigen ligase
MTGSGAALPEGVRVAGMVLAALLAAGAVLAPTVRARAWAMLGALALTPVLLLAQIWDTPQLHAVRDRPALALAGALVALAGVGALAWVAARRPGLVGVLALAALPFRVPVEAGGSTALLLVPLYVVIGAGALAWLVPRLATRWSGEPAPRGKALEWVLLGGLVLYAVQAVYAADPSTALQQEVFFYVPFALLYALLRDVRWTGRQLAWGGGVLVGLALVFCAVGFWEFATRRLLWNPKVIASNQVEAYFRVNSLFFDPNIYGRFLVLVMIGLAGVVVWTRGPRWLGLSMAALVVLWGGLLTTLSQSSFAALVVGLAVLAWLRWGPRVVIGPALAAAAVGLVLVFAFPGALNIDLTSTQSLRHATSGRSLLVKGGLDLAARRPLLGWGSGSFQDEYRRRERSSGREATSASHTIPITVAAEQGLVGLAVYVALLVLAFARLLRGAARSPVRAVLAAGFAAVVLHTWVYAAFLEDPVTWALLAIGTAVLPVAHARHRARSPVARPAPPPVSAAGAISAARRDA